MFIDRDGKGNIIGQYAARQYAGQEQLADNDPALLLIAGKATTLAAINAASSSATAGFAWNGATYPIDDLSRQNTAAWGSIALGVVVNAPGLAWPAGFVWVASDNSRTPFAAAADFLAFAQAAALQVTALVLNGRTLKDAVTAAKTPADLAAVDPSKGW
jgi:hypothetical protein